MVLMKLLVMTTTVIIMIATTQIATQQQQHHPLPPPHTPPQHAFNHVDFDIESSSSRSGGSIHLEVPSLLCLYASVLRREGRNDQALQAYSRAVDISKELYGASTITATSLNNMAFLAFHMELKQQARALFMDALTVLVHVHGPTDPRLVPILNNIGRVEESLGDLNAAQGLYTRAMAITSAASASSNSPSPSTALTSPLSPPTPGSTSAPNHQHLFSLWLQKRAGTGFVVIRVRALNLTKPRSQPSFQVEFASSKKLPKGHSVLIGASRTSHKEEFFPSSVEQVLGV